MPKPNIADARALSDEALSDEILTVKKELFELRLQKATRQLEGPHQLKWARHRLAQLMLVEGERSRGATPVAPPAESASQTKAKSTAKSKAPEVAESAAEAKATKSKKAEAEVADPVVVEATAVEVDETDADESEVS